MNPRTLGPMASKPAITPPRMAKDEFKYTGWGCKLN
jgi:hypothetical protein